MSEDEDAEIKIGLEKRRDELQKTLGEARHQRVELMLKDIDEYRSLLQKVGELSLILGAAVIPLIVASDRNHNLNHLNFIFAGTALYLVNGVVAFWRSKNIFERNADSSPFVGLDEEIKVYPLVNAHNKLLIDLKNKGYIEEFRKASTDLLEWAPRVAEEQKPRVSIWLDIMLVNFVLASMLVMRPLWPYPSALYWVSCITLLILVVVFTAVGYMRSWKDQVMLITKKQKLAEIKADYQKWHNDNILNPK